MKKRIAIIATAVLVVATLIIGGTLAFYTDKGEVNNVITMGNVKISLDEPMFKDSTHNEFIMTDVMPNQSIVKDPTITNNGDHDAYIRCKVTITGENLSETQKEELESRLNITASDWKKSGGYYYYQKKLAKKPAEGVSKVVFFDKMIIPETWDNAIATTRFKVEITAEAIQADNFAPTTNAGGEIIAWQYSNNSNVPVAPASSAIPAN